MNETETILNELYKDFFEKKKSNKIKKDNLKEEIEVLKKSIEHASEISDESKLFSPRNSDNEYRSVEDMKKNLDEKTKLYNDSCSEYEYYNDYCKKIKVLLNNEEKKNKEELNDINKVMYGTDKTEKIIKNEHNSISDEKKTEEYSLNLNYDIESIKNKIVNIKHKSETCIKIFNNDRGRAKQEIININKALDILLKSL